MKQKWNISLRIALLYAVVPAFALPVQLTAQQKVSDVRVVVKNVRQEKDSVRAVLDIEMVGVSVSPREQLYLFPVIQSGFDERKLTPVIINGRIQQSVERRKEVLSGISQDSYATYGTKGRKLFHERLAYSSAVPLEGWMKDARVAMVGELRDCRGEFHRVSMEVIASNIEFAKRPVRDFGFNPPVKFVVPPREEIKRRAESGEARIIYTVGNSEIKPDIGNNRGELQKISNSLEKIKYVPGAKVDAITISSYASPEGTWQSNLTLSERRAASLVLWIRLNHDMSGILLSSHGYGEDWDGLAELVGNDPAMSTEDKEYVLGVIADSGILDGRDRDLMNYKGGSVYRYMLGSLYPPLRRSAYKIEYTVPEYSIETIREVYKSAPDMLSLYELHLLANTYEPASPQFREVISKAAEIYPDDKISRISVAALSLMSDDTAAARAALDGLEDVPEAWLPLAVVCVREGDAEKAESYVNRAVAAGNPDAGEYTGLLREYREKEDKYQQELKEWEMYGTE